MNILWTFYNYLQRALDQRSIEIAALSFDSSGKYLAAASKCGHVAIFELTFGYARAPHGLDGTANNPTVRLLQRFIPVPVLLRRVYHPWHGKTRHLIPLWHDWPVVEQRNRNHHHRQPQANPSISPPPFKMLATSADYLSSSTQTMSQPSP